MHVISLGTITLFISLNLFFYRIIAALHPAILSEREVLEHFVRDWQQHKVHTPLFFHEQFDMLEQLYKRNGNSLDALDDHVVSNIFYAIESCLQSS